jgi:hypothetical protein
MSHLEFPELLAENKRLRRLAELLHDTYCTPDHERFPEHGEEICRIFWMDAVQHDQFWSNEAAAALGLEREQRVPEWHIDPERVFCSGMVN